MTCQKGAPQSSSSVSSARGDLFSFRSSLGEEVRLRSHSAIRFDAVRVSLEGVNLLSAGHGIPSEMLVSTTESLFVSFRSPKLCFR